MITEFETHVQKQVMDFLQTILMIDDEAYRREDGSSALREDELDWDDDSEPVPAKSSLSLVSPSSNASGDELDVQEVSLKFAEEGLACSILSPQTIEENRQFRPAFLSTAKRADALILDWNLNEDNGSTVLQLIGDVLQVDRESPRHRLRLLMVYTGEPDLLGIAEQVSQKTNSIFSEFELDWDEDKVSFTHGPVRVAVFAKEHILNLPENLTDRRKSVAELPRIVVSEFSKLSLGLVTSAALNALSGIRNDAHRILNALRPELDAAVLGQRVALPHPEDVENQIEDLLVSELQAVVQDNQVGANVNIQRIEEWVSHHQYLSPRGMSEFEYITRDGVLQLLSKGFTDKEELMESLGVSKSQIGKLSKRSATEFFVIDERARLASDNLFALRMSMRSHYSNPKRTLQLGTVVELEDKFYVCVQPLCDSVRIEKRRPFPLLPLHEVTNNDGNKQAIRLTVLNDDKSQEYKRLQVDPKPSGILMVTFDSTGGGTIDAVDNESNLVFIDYDKRAWRWIGDLKLDHAQRVIERLSTEFSRVGLEEAEILRLGI